ncbi:glycosyltransferase [Streptomyces malaysiensis]|uniref:glycosyltransferase n=1 Tax=Streptomyces malaysiensis TaxID=92644 RepID=UPI002B2F7F82|nr:glycosyltransferase [Streptomyces malaysiensis]
MKFSHLLDLVHVPGGIPASRLSSDLALVTSVSLDLADTPLSSADPADLAADYASYRPRPVTAVVLTYNEEERIAGCLSALADDVDHCLLVDSGSVDGTAEQALRTRGDARILSAPWADDFSRQRNLAFGEVTDGWLCHVDADEVLAMSHAGRLRRALSVLDYLLPDSDFVVSPVIADVGGPVYTNTQRVLRTDGPFRFRGQVHEHPYDPDGRAPARVQVDVRFDHSGYLPEVVDQRGKRERYVRLDRLARTEEPDNPNRVGTGRRGTGQSPSHGPSVRTTVDAGPRQRPLRDGPARVPEVGRARRRSQCDRGLRDARRGAGTAAGRGRLTRHGPPAPGTDRSRTVRSGRAGAGLRPRT